MNDKECHDIISLINEKFLIDFNTVLVGGFNEPFYKSFHDGQEAQIQYTKNYIRSAIHELSHWCVAGKERRNLDDYGYWYAEDGRSQQQQDEFFRVEVRPQTIEWAISIIAGVKFETSVDNLTTLVDGVEDFKKNLYLLIKEFIKNDFPIRVRRILKLISNHRNIKDYKHYISISLYS